MAVRNPERLDQVKKFQTAAIGLILGTALLVNAKDKLMTVFSHPARDPVSLLQVCLLLIVIALVVRFIQATAHELILAQEYLEEVPIIKAQTYSVIIALGIVLGVLGFFADTLYIFAPALAVLNLADLWGSWLFLKQFETALPMSKETPELAIMKKYYFGHPTLLRIGTIMFVSLLTFTIAVAAHMSQSTSQSFKLSCVGYVMIILNIVVGEIVISVWRHSRDIALDNLSSKKAAPK